MIQWRADSPHVGETSSDMFFSQEEVNVCVFVMFVMCFLRVLFNKCLMTIFTLMLISFYGAGFATVV